MVLAMSFLSSRTMVRGTTSMLRTRSGMMMYRQAQSRCPVCIKVDRDADRQCAERDDERVSASFLLYRVPVRSFGPMSIPQTAPNVEQVSACCLVAVIRCMMQRQMLLE